MASPLDTSVVHFHSGMPNMPTLNGQVGTLIGVLDLLVNGGDIKVAASLQVVGGVATLGFTGQHAAQASPQAVIEISGVTNMAGLNGRQKVTSVGPGVLRFPTNEPDGTAAGTITFKMAAAGWQWVHAGTNKGFLRSSSPQRHGQGLRVDDSFGQVARVVGYESMTDVDTGVNPFPNASQIAGGGYWWKSAVATAAPVHWELIADERFFMLGIAPHTPSSATAVGTVGYMPMAFGDAIALNPAGNPNATVLVASTATSYGAFNSVNSGLQSVNTSTGVFTARSMDGGTVSVPAIKRAYSSGTSGPTSGTDPHLGPVAEAPDNRFYTTRMCLGSASGAPQADVPGAIYIPQSATYGQAARGDTADGYGEFEGRLLRAWPVPAGGSSMTSGVNVSSLGLMMVDLTGPWR